MAKKKGKGGNRIRGSGKRRKDGKFAKKSGGTKSS